MKTQDTFPGKYYVVTSPNGCTVTAKKGKQLGTVEAGQQGGFAAIDSAIIVSDEEAEITQVFNVALIAGGNGGGGVSATGEKVMPLAGDTLEVQHATWFENASQGSIAVLPAAWKNAVATCYLKTAVPVELAGVRWLYGQPTLVAGYTYVVALQQVGADVVLANLAYTIPQ